MSDKTCLDLMVGLGNKYPKQLLNSAVHISFNKSHGHLDKKMKNILEREDLPADERLKLYDQSFTRYLNVDDD
jgi:hypothetical protein